MWEGTKVFSKSEVDILAISVFPSDASLCLLKNVSENKLSEFFVSYQK
jgi:hypothetical protein